ncbi:hypothetical protein HOD30_04230 [Candidatus Peregrinibacteria bacterium]|jgi:hypothetical protein|nr:hypothetical protein [Candidatus Peregrinibacteria bacterium]MBT4632167.1 hypothetical protein [Candidatus Peregrinibacteria bacterium]MBT5516728.1 hypothetical protein [Candidatus Peregrinibacteria bacterium]MBT5824085.1 hypothetical protein [Candidatus Peregrinibacteria bacterium]
MDYLVELAEEQDILLEIGDFQDLKHLIEILNNVFESVEYRLEKVEGKKDTYLFCEDPDGDDEYECGMIIKMGKKAYAFSPVVHELVLGAYQKYLDETE